MTTTATLQVHFRRPGQPEHSPWQSNSLPGTIAAQRALRARQVMLPPLCLDGPAIAAS